MRNSYTVESVLRGHPDKICDQISDAILDECLKQDNKAHAAIECMGCGNNLVIGGEISSHLNIDVKHIARQIYKQIGYDEELSILNLLRPQSSQLNDAIRCGGSGDQCIVYGYAIKNEYNYLPIGVYLSNKIAKNIDKFRYTTDYLLPDGKIQIIIKDNIIKDLFINVQHRPNIDNDYLSDEINKHVISKIDELKNVTAQVNKDSSFLRGGFDNDTGLTGRKIMVDTYGGLVQHGGGAFSGKDPSKMDRAAAYMARFISKNIVANGLTDECLVSIAYCFGQAHPIMVNVCAEKEKISRTLIKLINSKFDLRPEAIIERLSLRQILYLPTSLYGHFTNSQYPWEEIISL